MKKTKVTWKRDSHPAVIHGNYTTKNGVVTGEYTEEELLICQVLSDTFTKEAKSKFREKYIKLQEKDKK